MKQEKAVEEITLFGHRINIYEDKLEIYNNANVPFYDFKSTADRLVQYLIDEAFIEKKKMRVEIISPVENPK
jgi:uracil phosphoribosyltransferase